MCLRLPSPNWSHSRFGQMFTVQTEGTKFTTKAAASVEPLQAAPSTGSNHSGATGPSATRNRPRSSTFGWFSDPHDGRSPPPLQGEVQLSIMCVPPQWNFQSFITASPINASFRYLISNLFKPHKGQLVKLLLAINSVIY